MQDAINALDIVTSYSFSDAAPFHQLGFAYEWENKLDDAIIAYEKAVTIDPSFSPSYIQLAGIYQKKGADSKTVELLDIALSHNPSDPQLYLAKAVALKRMGKIDEAVSACKDGLALNPYDSLRIELEKLLSQCESRM